MLAAGLLLLAVAAASRGLDGEALRRATAGDLLALAGLVLVNLLAAGLLFWAVTRSFDAEPPVPAGRMVALVAASSLLNYIPAIRAGLVGRTAYLRARHSLPIAQSLLSLVVVMAVAAAVGAASLLVLIGGAAGYAAFVAATLLLTLATPAARFALRRPARLWGLWVPLRVLDLLAASARLWLAFHVVGHPIPFDAAILAGSASVAVKLLGVTPNGLGLSEWAVAGLAAALAPVTAAEGAAAALVDRGVEVIVVAAAGLVAMAFLRRAAGAARAAPTP